MWYAIHDAAGRLVSTGTVIADPLPTGLTAVPIGEAPPAGDWNPATRTFDAPKISKPALPVIDFLRRFHMVNEEAPIRAAAATDPVIATFLGRLNVIKEVYLDHPETIAGVNYLASKGLIAPGRSAEILA